ncbi:MAG: DnaB-like helicase C-terminal domain-containing protein [Halanaerobiales bacterium]
MDYISQQKDIDNLEFDSMTIYSIAKRFPEIQKVLKKIFDNSNDFIRYIETLKELPVDPKNIDIHIEELKRKNFINDIKNKYQEGLEADYSSQSPEDIIKDAESSILQVANRYMVDTNTEEPEQIGKGLRDEYLQRSPTPNGFQGLPIPSAGELNEFTGGLLRPGSVTVINAQTGIGKSIFLKSVVKHIGYDLGYPIYWGANEQNKNEQKDRLLAEIADIPIGIIENGLYNHPDNKFQYKGNSYNTGKLKEKVMNAVDELESAPIFIDQIRGYTPEILVQRAKYFKTRHDIAAFVWDYVKEPSDYGGDEGKLRHWLANVVINMKEQIADPLEIPVLTASQAKTYEYWMSAESYGIEKFCTSFCLLRELSEKEKAENPLGGNYGFTVKKNRFGAKHEDYKNRWIGMDFDKTKLKFQKA